MTFDRARFTPSQRDIDPVTRLCDDCAHVVVRLALEQLETLVPRDDPQRTLGDTIRSIRSTCEKRHQR